MSDDHVTVTAQEEDRTQTIPFAIYAGKDEEVVFVGEYNADQMARVIDQTFTRYYSIDEYEVYDDPSHIFDSKEADLTPAEFFKRMGVTPSPEDLDELAEEAAKEASFLSEDVGPYVPEVARFLELIQDEKDHQKFREFASAYISTYMPQKILEFYQILIAEVMDYSLRMLAIHKKQKRALAPSPRDLEKLVSIVRQKLNERLNAQDPGRPPAFRSKRDFLKVLDRVLPTITKTLSRREVWGRMRKDPLCQLEPAAELTQSDLKTFDLWLRKCKKNWAYVLQRHEGLKSGKNSTS